MARTALARDCRAVEIRAVRALRGSAWARRNWPAPKHLVFQSCARRRVGATRPIIAESNQNHSMFGAASVAYWRDSRTMRQDRTNVDVDRSEGVSESMREKG